LQAGFGKRSEDSAERRKLANQFSDGGFLPKAATPIYGDNFPVRQETGGHLHGARPAGLPARQGRVACVFKEKSQRRRFDVAGAKDHVGFAVMPCGV